MKVLSPLLLLPFLTALPATAQLDLTQTLIQSPRGWRLVGINGNAGVWWIKPSTIKGDVNNRMVQKLSVLPDTVAKISESWVHIDCPRAVQRQSLLLNPFAQSPPLTINQGSVWETIGKLICPPGTYGTARLSRPVPPSR